MMSVMFGMMSSLSINLYQCICCCMIMGFMRDVKKDVVVMQMRVMEVLDSLMVLQKVIQCSVMSILMFIKWRICVWVKAFIICFILMSSSRFVFVMSICY